MRNRIIVPRRRRLDNTFLTNIAVFTTLRSGCAVMTAIRVLLRREHATLVTMSGRFAPSPTGALHLGNLRTALLAWLAARQEARGFLVRIEDLDPVASSHEAARLQLEDLAALGIDWDAEPVRQSARFDLYRAAIDELAARELVYPCWCTRREIQQAAAAPHGEPAPDGVYPGTCRDLDSGRRAERARRDRRPALRLRAQVERETVVDALAGRFVGLVDDVVVQRNDGVPAYNLAVVVDDHLQGVSQVVRGADLLSSTPRQVHLQRLLGYATPAYAHVPIVLGPDGARLAKRHGAVTLADLEARGFGARRVLALLAASVGLCDPDDDVDPRQLIDGFRLGSLPSRPWQPDLDAL
jgi:glutamyl-tRNA synthetase